MLKAIYQNICQFIVNYCDKLFSSTMTKACLYKILYSIPEKVGYESMKPPLINQFLQIFFTNKAHGKMLAVRVPEHN